MAGHKPAEHSRDTLGVQLLFDEITNTAVRAVGIRDLQLCRGSSS